jgi:hypothetical protein
MTDNFEMDTEDSVEEIEKVEVTGVFICFV